MKAAWGVLLTTAALIVPAADTHGSRIGQRTIEFNIPEQPVDSALLAFARQAGVQVLFPPEEFLSIRANSLDGEHELHAGLQRLIAGTPVHASINEHGQLVVRIVPEAPEERRPVADAQQSGAAPRGILPSALDALLGRSAGGRAEADPLDRGEAPLEEVIVTGSRITRTWGMTTAVPVTSLSLQEVEMFDPGGTLVEQLSGLHQLFASQSTQDSSGAFMAGSGSSRLNLRNLGTNRTLVLFDGMRVVPSNMQGFVDVDAFPSALIRSVDVVTGGASAAYGADALGGVVNFVLNRDFEGVRVRVGNGINEWGDGYRGSASVAGGMRFTPRTHAVGSLQLQHMDQVMRPPEELGSWWQRWGHVTNPEWYPGAPPGVPRRLTLPWVSSTVHSPTGVLWGRAAPGVAGNNPPLETFALNGHTFLDDGSGVRPLGSGDVVSHYGARGSTASQSGGPEAQIANRAFANGPEGRGTRTRHAFGALKHELGDYFSGFAQVLVGRTEAFSRDTRSPYTLRDAWHGTLFRDNAFLPPEVAIAMDDAGLEQVQIHKAGSFAGDHTIGIGDGLERYTTFTASAGVEARLPNGWDVTFAWQSGRSYRLTGRYGQTRVDRMLLGMDAVRHPDTGEIVCRVQLFNPTQAQLAATPGLQGRESASGGPLRSPVGLDDTIGDCVPFNVMGRDTMSPEAVAYTQSDREDRTHIRQNFAELLVTGQLMRGHSFPLHFALGTTWRDQEFRQWVVSDVYDFGPPINAPELGIQGVPPGYEGGSESLHRFTSARDAHGDLHVWELFAELDMPVWYSGAGSPRIDTNLALRTADYSRAGRVHSWKAGLDVQVSAPLRLRATRSRDVREPSFFELFNNRGGTGATIDDPLTGTSYLTTARQAGNPLLAPEIGDTLVAGFVYHPARLPQLQLSADYYDVEVRGAVTSLDPQRVVDGCHLEHLQGFCHAVTRDPVSGLIIMIDNGYLNVARARVEGIDFELVWRMQPDWFAGRKESLVVRALGGYLIERSDTPLDSTRQNFAASIDNPKLNGNLSVSYQADRYIVQLQQRHIESTVRNVYWVEGIDVDRNRVASSSYTNLHLGYLGEMTGSGGSWQVGLNVTNLFDRPPPIVASYGAGGAAQTIPSGRDQLGRRYLLTFGFAY